MCVCGCVCEFYNFATFQCVTLKGFNLFPSFYLLGGGGKVAIKHIDRRPRNNNNSIEHVFHIEEKAKGRQTHKQAAGKGGCSKGLAEHLRGGNAAFGFVCGF